MFRKYTPCLAVFAGVVLSANTLFAGSVAAPSVGDVRVILSDLSDRNVRVNSKFLDPGDRGHGYVFTAPVDLAILGSGKNNSRSELRAFGRTGDKKRGGASNPFVDDGQRGNRIDIEIGSEGELSDDLAALLSGLNTDWLSAAVVAPGEFLAFNVKGTRGNAPIDTVVFTGKYFDRLHSSSMGGETAAAVPLPAGVLLLLTGLGGFLALRRFRTA